MRPALIPLSLVTAALLTASPAHSQWDIQPSPTTSDLRGIHSLGNGIAWASGSEGAVLRTTDDGAHWQLCPTPPNAEHLDFRGIQAFDASTAIVMSSGKGSLSRLYKTTDACQTWKLVVTNEEPKGFWDSLRMFTPQDGFLAGDPVNGILYFAENTSYWNNFLDRGEDRLWKSAPGETAFAASNSSLSLGAFGEKAGEVREVWFGTGGVAGSRVFHYKHFNGGEPERESLVVSRADVFPKSKSGGIFALHLRSSEIGIAVGGDYRRADAKSSTASFTADGDHWNTPESYPHGFRSSVAYSEKTKTWITVGPNGTDISTDDGRNWRALRPTPAEPPDADRDWNALSLPFVVGPHGRIGKLRPDALTPPQQPKP